MTPQLNAYKAKSTGHSLRRFRVEKISRKCFASSTKRRNACEASPDVRHALCHTPQQSASKATGCLLLPVFFLVVLCVRGGERKTVWAPFDCVWNSPGFHTAKRNCGASGTTSLGKRASSSVTVDSGSKIDEVGRRELKPALLPLPEILKQIIPSRVSKSCSRVTRNPQTSDKRRKRSEIIGS